jgi:hypothetical protein
VLIAGGDPVAIRVCLLELREQGNFNFAIIYRSLAGAPEEIRTPDPQIRSLVHAQARLRCLYTPASAFPEHKLAFVRALVETAAAMPLLVQCPGERSRVWPFMAPHPS